MCTAVGVPSVCGRENQSLTGFGYGRAGGNKEYWRKGGGARKGRKGGEKNEREGKKDKGKEMVRRRGRKQEIAKES